MLCIQVAKLPELFSCDRVLPRLDKSQHQPGSAGQQLRRILDGARPDTLLDAIPSSLRDGMGADEKDTA